MKIELKRIINNHISIYWIITCIISFLVGYFLLVSLDGYGFDEVSLSMLQYSIYTVYTQIGFFVFPILSINLFTMDYKAKNIFFYKIMGKTAVSYFISKVLVMIIFISIGSFLSTFFISVLYGNFSNSLLFFLKLMNISIFIILTSSLCGFLFRSMILAYCISFGSWILSIIFSVMAPIFKFLCFYDASLERHSDFGKILNNNVIMDTSVLPKMLYPEILYNIVVFIFVFVIVSIFKSRWIKNGI